MPEILGLLLRSREMLLDDLHRGPKRRGLHAVVAEPLATRPV